MQVTKYDYETVNAFWQKAKIKGEDMLKKVELNLAKWNAANDACSGIQAIPDAVGYSSKAVEAVRAICESIEAGHRDNEEYRAEAEEFSQGIELD